MYENMSYAYQCLYSMEHEGDFANFDWFNEISYVEET